MSNSIVQQLAERRARLSNRQQITPTNNNDEKKHSDKIDGKNIDKIKQINDAHNILENHKHQVEQHAIKMKSYMTDELNKIITALEEKRLSLNKQIEDWKLNQLQTLDGELLLLAEQKHVISDKSDNKKDNKFEITDEYITKHTQLIDIEFNGNIRFSNPSYYGTFQNNCKNDMIKIPSIKLAPVNNAISGNVGYQWVCGLRWTIFYNGWKEKIPPHFTIMFKNDADENKNNQWQKAIILEEIKAENNDTFCVQINTRFEYDQKYNFRIGFYISKPLLCEVRSNIISYTRDNPCSRHFGGNGIEFEIQPQTKGYNMFQTNSQGLPIQGVYKSKLNRDFNDNENDVFILKMKSTQFNELWFPNGFSILNNVKADEAKQGVKTVNIAIGDGHNKWFLYNTVNVGIGNMNKGWDRYNIEGVDWKVVGQNKLKYVKIEFITNHGQNNTELCRFVVKSFGLMGMRYPENCK